MARKHAGAIHEGIATGCADEAAGIRTVNRRHLLLQRLLAEHYGLSEVQVTPAARDFVAETFVVESQSERYFAKVVPVSRNSARFEASLPVVAALTSAGVTQIPAVIPTVRGGLSVTSGDRICALFGYIDGQWTFEYDFERYVTLIASIHGKTRDIAVEPPKESFALPFVDSLTRGVKAALSLVPSDECEDRLQQIVRELAEEWEQDIARAHSWGACLQRSRDIDLVVTHGDGPGNVLQDANGEIYLVDWDDVMLAPRERDLWFHLRESTALDVNTYHGNARTLLGCYRKVFPNYQVNSVARSFYVCSRYLDDLEGFLWRIMEPGRKPSEKKRYLDLLEKDCLTWLRPWVRSQP